MTLVTKNITQNGTKNGTHDVTKEYIKNKLLSHKFFKGKRFYYGLINLYSTNKDLVKKIILNLYKITSYKQHLYILYYSKNKELNNFIMDYLIKVYKNDLRVFNSKQYSQISMLPKWLPRAKSKFDKKCNFVHIFSRRAYPHLDRQVAHKVYRKTVSEMSKKLNIIEPYIAGKKLEEYNYDNLSYHNFVKNYNLLWKNKEKMVEYIKKKNDKVEFLVKRVLTIMNSSKSYEEELNILNSVWNEKYKKILTKYNTIPYKKTLVLDLSNSLYKTMKWQLIAIYLLFLYKNNKVIINGKNNIIITKKDTLKENILSFTSNMNICKTINFEELKNTYKNIIIITDKLLDQVDPNIDILYLKNEVMKQNKNIYTGNPFYYVNNNKIRKNKIIDKILVEKTNYKLVYIFIIFICTLLYIFL